MTGEFPTFQIDHINGVRDDNRWWNLREATPRQNQANKIHARINATGYRGVQLTPAGNYRAKIRGSKGKYVHLGIFPTAAQAYTAFCDAKIKMHGEFSAVNNGGSTEKSLETNG
jgi:hypothetical protein